MDYKQYTADDFLMNDQFLAYCRGSDPNAVVFWERWQQERPPNLDAFREAERLCRILNGNKPRLDQSLQELEALLGHQAQPEKVIAMPTPPSASRWWAVAASVLLVGALGWAGYWFWGDQYITYETAYNQQRTVQLPDGSTVALNSHSVLRHKRNAFTDAVRRVELQGEAFFKVEHLASGASFRVETEGAFDVQVLGTEFTVHNRPSLRRVVLNTGKVQVQFHDKRPAITLRPGQLIEMGTESQTVQPRTVRADQYNAWLRHQLVFDKASLAEVVRTVEDQFGIKVQIDGAVSGSRTFSGILPINQPETALKAVAELNQLTLRKTTDGFRLSQ